MSAAAPNPVSDQNIFWGVRILPIHKLKGTNPLLISGVNIKGRRPILGDFKEKGALILVEAATVTQAGDAIRNTLGISVENYQGDPRFKTTYLVKPIAFGEVLPIAGEDIVSFVATVRPDRNGRFYAAPGVPRRVKKRVLSLSATLAGPGN